MKSWPQSLIGFPWLSLALNFCRSNSAKSCKKVTCVYSSQTSHPSPFFSVLQKYKLRLKKGLKENDTLVVVKTFYNNLINILNSIKINLHLVCNSPLSGFSWFKFQGRQSIFIVGLQVYLAQFPGAAGSSLEPNILTEPDLHVCFSSCENFCWCVCWMSREIGRHGPHWATDSDESNILIVSGLTSWWCTTT